MTTIIAKNEIKMDERRFLIDIVIIEINKNGRKTKTFLNEDPQHFNLFSLLLRILFNLGVMKYGHNMCEIISQL